MVMERGHISIQHNIVSVTYVNGTVWLSQHQIADLFNVFYSKVNSNSRSILKNGLLRERDVMHTHYFDGGSVDLYNLEMITTLAFRFDSNESFVFRKWVMRKLSMREATREPQLMVYYDKTGLLN